MLNNEERHALRNGEEDQSSSSESDDEDNEEKNEDNTGETPARTNRQEENAAETPQARDEEQSRGRTVDEPDRDRRIQGQPDTDRHVTRRARSLSRPRALGATAADVLPPNVESRSLCDDHQSMDRDQIFIQLLRTMVEQNKVQHQMQEDLQRQNSRLLDRIVSPTACQAQDNRIDEPSNPQRPFSANYGDPNDTRRKARKAFSSHFSSKLFSGKFGDNWIRHRDNFIQYCQEWEIPETRFSDFLKETLRGDELNFVEDLIKADPHITWNRLSTLVTERYANINRQKEVSDRLHSLRFADFETSGEDPATTLERITAYIDKHVPIALSSDQTDAAKARFISNATRGQSWALHAKGRISASATYERTAQAFATSIRDLAEHEEGRTLSRRNRRGTHHRISLYKTSGSKVTAAGSDNDSEPDIYLQNEVEVSQYPQEAFFGSSRFARDSREFKRNSCRWNQSYGQRQMKTRKFSSEGSPSNAASQVGCFNCGQKGCSVAKCPRPKDPKRIADNLSRWRKLRKIKRDAKVNLSMVSAICFCPSEAQEVLIAATYLNEQGNDHEYGGSQEHVEEKEF